jgi:BirA family biotin operon repressor/biotin-[acetyl-CoA-carboxylase] ligase
MNYTKYRFDCIPSTQDFLREKRAEGENAVAVAKKQSGGKGTKGRSFESNEGGLWLSILLFHEDALAQDGFLMMARSAVAVCKTLEEYGLQPKIKWANDVLVDGKKICGVLTENVCRGNRIASTLFGIGLNINNTLGEELQNIATTLRAQTGKEHDLQEVEERLLAHFFADFSFQEYAKRLAFLGQEIAFCVGDNTFTATLLGVSERGELLLSVDGQKVKYAYGEISLTKGREGV